MINIFSSQHIILQKKKTNLDKTSTKSLKIVSVTPKLPQLKKLLSRTVENFKNERLNRNKRK